VVAPVALGLVHDPVELGARGAVPSETSQSQQLTLLEKDITSKGMLLTPPFMLTGPVHAIGIARVLRGYLLKIALLCLITQTSAHTKDQSSS
jgi:hypothetical protein